MLIETTPVYTDVTGIIHIIVGKSATGKDTFIKELQKIGFNYIPLTCTRKQRDHEKQGDPYNFVSHEQFERMIEENKFIEARYYDMFEDNNPVKNYYGTTLKDLINTRIPSVISVDIECLDKFLYSIPHYDVCIWYLESNLEIRQKRCQERPGFDPKEWERRVAKEDKEYDLEQLYNIIKKYEINCFDILYNNTTIENLITDFYSKLIDSEYFIKFPKLEELFIDYYKSLNITVIPAKTILTNEKITRIENIKQEVEDKITLEHIESKIDKVEYFVFDMKTTICNVTLKNGFNVTGESSCVNPKNYNKELGEQISYENAKKKIWALEGYLLQEKLYIDNLNKQSHTNESIEFNTSLKQLDNKAL